MKEIPSSGDVFISYSSANQAQVDQITAALRSEGLTYWLAPESIAAGDIWPQEIVAGIRGSRLALLVVSDEFCASRHTPREVTLADNYQLPLLPIRLSSTNLPQWLQYYLCNCHWVDASGCDLQQCLPALANAARSYVRTLRATRRTTPPIPDGCVSAESLGVRPRGPLLRLVTGDLPAALVSSDSPSVLLMPHNEFIPLLGRETEVHDFTVRLKDAGSFRWWALLGEAGMGKTRLAREFIGHAIKMHWHAGFLGIEDLHSFVSHPEFQAWRPYVPTLIVVDYAAGHALNLKRLTSHLTALESEHIDGVDAKVRLLLIERHGSTEAGWLRDLLQSPQGVERELFSRTCHLDDLELRPPSLDGRSVADAPETSREIILATFKSWARRYGRPAPDLPDLSSRDWLMIQSNTLNRPLYLQMAAISACEAMSAEDLPTWGRGKCLRDAINRERTYIGQACRNAEERDAIERIAGILCVTGMGASGRADWMREVADELAALGVGVTAYSEETRRRTIFRKPEATSEEATSLIQPDILGEGFAATVLPTESDNPPVGALRRAVAIGGLSAWGNLIRMVQDLHGIEVSDESGSRRLLFKGIEDWLLPLLEYAPPEHLRRILALLPERSASLNPVGIRAAELLLGNIDSDSRWERAECLLALGMHRVWGGKGNARSTKAAEGELREATTLLASAQVSGETAESHLQGARAHRLLGMVLSDQNDTTGAIRESTLAGFRALGEIVEPARMEADVRRLLDAQPPDLPALAVEFANALNNLSIDLRFSGRYGLAIRCARAAVSTGEILVAAGHRGYLPYLGRYANNLAIAHELRREPTDALEAARQAVQLALNETRPDQFRSLGLCLDHLFTLEKAERTWSAAHLTASRAVRVYKELFQRAPEQYSASLIRAQRRLAQAQRNASVDGLGQDLDAETDALLEAELHSGRISVAEAAASWRQPAFPREVSDPHALGVIEHGKAMEFGDAGEREHAAEAARLAVLHFREAAAPTALSRDPYRWACRHCDLASALVLMGDFGRDQAALHQAIQLADHLLSQFNRQQENVAFVVGATLDNLGHAQFRLGTMTGDAALVRKGVATLREGVAHLRAHGFESAADSTNRLVRSAETALDEMEA